MHNARLYSYDAVAGWSQNATTNHDASDLHALHGSLPAGVGGQFRCSSLSPSGRCTHGHTIFDYAQILNNRLTAQQMRSLACHEIGHGVGLHHRSTNDSLYQCMSSKVGSYPVGLGDHNGDHMKAGPWY